MPTVQTYQQRTEPSWFTRVRETFGSLIYDTRVDVLGIDTYRRYTIASNKILLDYYEKSFVKWK